MSTTAIHSDQLKQEKTGVRPSVAQVDGESAPHTAAHSSTASPHVTSSSKRT